MACCQLLQEISPKRTVARWIMLTAHEAIDVPLSLRQIYSILVCSVHFGGKLPGTIGSGCKASDAPSEHLKEDLCLAQRCVG